MRLRVIEAFPVNGEMKEPGYTLTESETKELLEKRPHLVNRCVRVLASQTEQ